MAVKHGSSTWQLHMAVTRWMPAALGARLSCGTGAHTWPAARSHAPSPVVVVVVVVVVRGGGGGGGGKGGGGGGEKGGEKKKWIVCFAFRKSLLYLVASVFSLEVLAVCAVRRANLTNAGSIWSMLVALAVMRRACAWKKLRACSSLGCHPLRLGWFLYLGLMVLMLVGMVSLAEMR